MNRITTTLGALAMTATAAAAGGIDRSGQDIDIIFEKGSAVSLSFGRINPSITSERSGSRFAPGLAGQTSDAASARSPT